MSTKQSSASIINMNYNKIKVIIRSYDPQRIVSFVVGNYVATLDILLHRLSMNVVQCTIVQSSKVISKSAFE